MVFRTSPNLGPDLEQFDTNYSGWMQPGVKITPELGNPELGSDGHYYVLVQAGATFASAGTAVTINETTWVATSGAGGYETPVDGIPDGAYFYARSETLPGSNGT